MTLHLPDDGFTVISSILASPYFLVVLAAYCLILARTVRESEPVFTGMSELSVTPLVLLTLAVAWILAEVLISIVPGLSWNTTGVLLRDGFVILFGAVLPIRLINTDSKLGQSLLGRLQPWGRLTHLGLLAFLVLGLSFWGVSLVEPFKVPVGTATNFNFSTLISGFQRVVVIPFCEEIIFRALIYPVFRSFLTLGGGIAAVSLLFAGLHGIHGVFWFQFAGSIIITTLFEITGSLLPGLVVHAGFNFLLIYGGVFLP